MKNEILLFPTHSVTDVSEEGGNGRAETAKRPVALDLGRMTAKKASQIQAH